jgi:glycosyltransferase involved in cell wall biosynthesis
MRFGTVVEENLSAANYRGIYPMRALERRRHEIVLPTPPSGQLAPAAMYSCDAILLYRVFDDRAKRIMSQLRARGIGVVYDNDDDFRHTPKDNPQYRSQRQRERAWEASVETAKRADVVTVTTPVLATRYQHAGVANIHVIENRLPGGNLRRKSRRHRGFLIGWVAGHEHAADARELRIADALDELQAQRPDVEVESVGVDLGLKARYRHTESVPFLELPQVMSRWDLAIAPLADTAFNATRSDIKVKEYGASGIPWLASPIGPYADLGEDQGGRLVPNGEWLAALTALVDDKGARKRLAKAGEKWAKTQTTDAVAGEWEAVLTEAARRAQARTQARARVPA